MWGKKYERWGKDSWKKWGLSALLDIRACQADGNILSAEAAKQVHAKNLGKPWTAAHQAFLSFTISWSLLRERLRSSGSTFSAGKVGRARLQKSTRLHSLDAHLMKDFRSLSLHSFLGFPGGSEGKDLPAMQIGFDWVGKIPWRRKWQPTLVFLPRESHGQRGLVGYYRWGRKDELSDSVAKTWLSD